MNIITIIGYIIMIIMGIGLIISLWQGLKNHDREKISLMMIYGFGLIIGLVMSYCGIFLQGYKDNETIENAIKTKYGYDTEIVSYGSRRCGKNPEFISDGQLYTFRVANNHIYIYSSQDTKCKDIINY